MATSSMAMNMNTLYDDLMTLCSQDDTFYYKDIRLYSIKYRIFNYRICSYATFQSRKAAFNCRGTMFNITNAKNVQLVSLPQEKFFNYHEGFGRKEYHERGRLGDKMEKMDGTLISTFLHGIASKEVRLKSKQSLTSKQVTEATQLLIGDLNSEIERLVHLRYTVDMEYTSPSNHVFVSYPQAQLTVLSIRSHADGQTLFASRLKKFLLENNFPTIIDHLVPFESIPPDVTHQQLLQDIYQQPYGEGYVVEIIQPDRSSYLVKIKTQKYLMIHKDGQDANSSRSLFEAIINEHADDLTGLFKDDTETLKRINEMEQSIRPKFNRMIESIEQFYQANKHFSKRDFNRSIITNENMKIYLPLLMRLYAGENNDYKGFAIKNAKGLFGISGDGNQLTTVNQNELK
ncbi:unnamed protein product [Rotaria magnacalcarata]|uniref:Uncharacterized protein n=1 Tax=Rotaria magnacalcarata TaxID=392030 RepID=A0A815E1M2_9BILA|nr:unnamed protein product [Rotaria magnacalcarata]CAF1300898.1 unnamed protein product [Rotaria magnacalcarata]CAF1981952.1 unnamed protein product [Rotaria magnacalcarata]CAF2156324.1 unnamed protein product [Rotaria magnacalcarata]CAF2192992.1 unnamed protein product [Rotaria magnacalcarata]